MEARDALATSHLSLADDGAVVAGNGQSTGLRLDPLLGGILVYIRDGTGMRYWLGSPSDIAPVLHWLTVPVENQPSFNSTS